MAHYVIALLAKRLLKFLDSTFWEILNLQYTWLTTYSNSNGSRLVYHLEMQNHYQAQTQKSSEM